MCPWGIDLLRLVNPFPWACWTVDFSCKDSPSRSPVQSLASHIPSSISPLIWSWFNDSGNNSLEIPRPVPHKHTDSCFIRRTEFHRFPLMQFKVSMIMFADPNTWRLPNRTESMSSQDVPFRSLTPMGISTSLFYFLETAVLRGRCCSRFFFRFFSLGACDGLMSTSLLKDNVTGCFWLCGFFSELCFVFSFVHLLFIWNDRKPTPLLQNKNFWVYILDSNSSVQCVSPNLEHFLDSSQADKNMVGVLLQSILALFKISCVRTIKLIHLSSSLTCLKCLLSFSLQLCVLSLSFCLENCFCPSSPNCIPQVEQCQERSWMWVSVLFLTFSLDFCFFTAVFNCLHPWK